MLLDKPKHGVMIADLQPLIGPSRRHLQQVIENKVEKLVEAAGVEPASEKVRNEKPTCVADSIFSSSVSESTRVTPP